MSEFACSLCSYNTTRRYNLTRHTSNIHHINADGVDLEPDKIKNKDKTVPEDLTCSKCTKQFKQRRSLLLHNCTTSVNPLQCQSCRVVFLNKFAKYRHSKTCTVVHCATGASNSHPSVDTGETKPSIVNNITNITNNNITNIHLTFPFFDDEQEFRFLHDHIDRKKFKQIWDHKNIERCFSMWAMAILSRDENFILQKKNLKDRFALVHTGDGHWEVAIDEDVFPTVTHELSCSALESTEKHKDTRMTHNTIPQIRSYMDAVNTGLEGVYENALQRVKATSVNNTKKKEAKARITTGNVDAIASPVDECSQPV